MNISLTQQLWFRSFVFALLAWGPTSAFAQVTILQEDFTGLNTVNLNGTLTEVGSATWTATPNFKSDGSVISGAGSATVPFSPLQGNIYSLTGTINGTNNDANWLGIGFADDATGTWTGSNPVNGNAARYTGTIIRGYAWAITASTTGQTAFYGPGAGLTGVSPEVGTDVTGLGAINLEIVLDTSGIDWEASFYRNGNLFGSHTYSGAPTIDSVGFSSLLGAAGTLSNFQLTQLAVLVNEWDVDGGGSFNLAGNWSENMVPSTGGIAIFGAVHTDTDTPAVVTLDAPVSLGEIRFANSNSYTLSGPSTLTLTGGASVATAQGVHEIAALVTGSVGFVKSGSGTLTIANGSNSYTGDTIVSAGILNVTNLGAINQASGVVNVAAGASLQFSGDGAGNGASGALTEEITGAGDILLGTGLTTEVITANTANGSFSGRVALNGGTLRVSNAVALGVADGTAATGTIVGGGAIEGRLELNGVTVVGERLQLDGRQPETTAPHFSSIGTSEWTGPIAGSTGGDQYNIESQSGTLTLSGDITMPDGTAIRTINLSGAGAGQITGNILEGTNANIAVVKRGTGTWTIDINSQDRSNYHQASTVVQEGTLAVVGKTIDGTGFNDDGELFSSTIEVGLGGFFDVSSFSTYTLQLLADPDDSVNSTFRASGDEVGQILSGAGTVVGNLAAFDDSTIAPGNSIGTLTINGNFSYSTYGSTISGVWNYELGDSTTAGDSDRLVVSGTTTLFADQVGDVIQVSLTPVEGALAQGDYVLVQSGSLLLTGANVTYAHKVRDSQGNDITSDIRQAVTVQNSGNNVVANVSGTSANLNWAGTAGSAWDVKTTSNWNSGAEQFNQLDNVTFGNVANKNVTVDANVAPGSVTFSGGGGSTYTVTGSGGMTGSGAVNITSGTVKLNNTGNAYSGSTTVANGAILEMSTSSTGSMVVNGTLSIGSDGIGLGGAQTFLFDNFNRADGIPLNGTTPINTTSGSKWVAAPFFEADGDIIDPEGNSAGGSATLAFTPANDSTYVLETSLVNVVGGNDWVALGFATGQSTGTGNSARFITGDVEGLAWALYRPAPSVAGPNTTFYGNADAPGSGGTVSGADWLVGALDNLGAVDIRITLDTTGGPGAWTTTMEADLGSGFQIIRATEVLLDEGITSVGIPVSDPDGVQGSIDFFSLTGTEPANTRVDGQTLTVNGDLLLGANSTLKLDLAQVGQDFIDVSGIATLNGTIDVTKLGSFTPDTGTQYTLLTAAGGIIDLGVDYLLPTGFNASIVDMTNLVLTFGLEGDFSGDGIVNAADYAVWRDSLGTAETYTQWKSNFGAGSGPGAGLGSGQSTVPEPASWLLLLTAIGLALLITYRKPFRHSGQCMMRSV